jgi:hypothetical protein
MTAHVHGLHDIIVHPLMSLRFVLFVQVFYSVFCDSFFDLLRHRKLKIEQHEPNINQDVHTDAKYYSQNYRYRLSEGLR